MLDKPTACSSLLEYRRSGLGPLISTSYAENFIRRLSWSISSHFGAIHFWNACCSPKSRTNLLKPPILGVPGYSGSLMLTFLRSSSPVLVIISSMSMPLCNHFHVWRANSGRITPFKGGAPLSPPRSWGPPSPSGMIFCHKILETLSYHMVKTRSLYLTWAPIGTQLWQTPKQNYHS